MSYRSILVALLCFGLMSCATGGNPKLKLPDFGHLRGKATESIDVNLGSFAFFVAQRFVDDTDPDGAAVKEVLKGVSSMRVRHYEFAEDFAYAQSDLDQVRSQLTASGWNSLARVHDRKQQENLDVYVSIEKEKITGLAVVASEPREFTIINIVGTLDSKQVTVLREKLAPNYLSSLRKISAKQRVQSAQLAAARAGYR
jgi:hypothetical protein